MCSEVAGECVAPPAGVVAEGTLEGLLPRVQFDVAQEIPLLCEGGTTLVAVEGPLPSMAALVYHEHIGSDADHAADVTLELAVG